MPDLQLPTPALSVENYAATRPAPTRSDQGNYGAGLKWTPTLAHTDLDLDAEKRYFGNSGHPGERDTGCRAPPGGLSFTLRDATSGSNTRPRRRPAPTTTCFDQLTPWKPRSSPIPT